jgi:hypothetical protein
MVTVPRADLDAMKAELRRLRREVGRAEALAAIKADPGPGPGDSARVFSQAELAQAWGIGGCSGCPLRHGAWRKLEALLQELRCAVQGAVFSLTERSR